MRVFRGAERAHLPPCALTIGNFDGLHRGHQALIAALRQRAAQQGLSTALMTFEPHPRELFSPDDAPVRLTTLREKLELLATTGIDYVIVQPFNRAFAALDATAFRDDIVATRLNARHVIIGDDFRFGARRAGDLALLAAHPQLTVETLDEVRVNQQRASSTAIRQALADGQLPQAAALLGRPYSISGRVVGGDKLGRELGFPTANIMLRHNRPPLMGIFVVEVAGLERTYQGVASLGVRPTVKGAGAAPVLEVHLFDFNAQIYGAHLTVRFMEKLRDEAKYDGLEALTRQIALDCQAARDWFAQQHLEESPQ
ncbi:bifunctional riboflavin kinase/FAD synthetase [Chitinibacteraceae bacterium HSL-7]